MAAEWLSEQPTNRNFLTPVGFKLDLEIFHGVDFFCQSASIPEIAIPFAEVQTPYRNIPIAGSGGINFGDLTQPTHMGTGSASNSIRGIISCGMTGWAPTWPS